jgi:hypothetical protein
MRASSSSASAQQSELDLGALLEPADIDEKGANKVAEPPGGRCPP